MGLGLNDAIELFNARVFAAIGYLDRWATATATLQGEFAQCDLETKGLLAAWERRGCFMHTVNHPKLFALASVAHAMAKRLGLPIRTANPDRYVRDNLEDAPVWPLYPEIGAIRGLGGDYCFKSGAASGQAILSLEEFVRASFEAYAASANPEARHVDIEAFGADAMAAHRKPAVASPARAPATSPSVNPYSSIPAHQRWRSAVADPAPADVDPVVAPRFRLKQDDRVASIGSCFAQHISRQLKAAGLNYYVTGPPPSDLGAEEAVRRGYGMFSARYGNVYSARQLDQLFARALGEDCYDEPPWVRPDGRFADPFRPSVEPEGFDNEAALALSRRTHLVAVREMMEGLDVLVFTLGLTEAWRSTRTGAVFPIAPGVVAGEWDANAFEFVNFGVDEVVRDLSGAIAKVRSVNPGARFIFTVSPVPLIATYEPRHVLSATTYSKAVLRVAADLVCRAEPSADYFPSYEIVSSAFSRGGYFEADLRNVTPAGVDHVMRLFLKHLYDRAPAPVAADQNYDVFCDEERLD